MQSASTKHVTPAMGGSSAAFEVKYGDCRQDILNAHPSSTYPRTVTYYRRIWDCQNTMDNYTFLANCPPTPPLSQHFALSEK